MSPELSDLLMRKLDIKDGDIVVIDHFPKHDKVAKESIIQLSQHLLEQNKHITFIGLHDHQTLQTLNEEEMNKLGWFKDSNI